MNTEKNQEVFIEVGDGDVLPLRSEIERHVDGDIGLSRAVMTAEDR